MHRQRVSPARTNSAPIAHQTPRYCTALTRCFPAPCALPRTPPAVPSVGNAGRVTHRLSNRRQAPESPCCAAINRAVVPSFWQAFTCTNAVGLHGTGMRRQYTNIWPPANAPCPPLGPCMRPRVSLLHKWWTDPKKHFLKSLTGWDAMVLSCMKMTPISGVIGECGWTSCVTRMDCRRARTPHLIIQDSDHSGPSRAPCLCPATVPCEGTRYVWSSSPALSLSHKICSHRSLCPIRQCLDKGGGTGQQQHRHQQNSQEMGT